MKRYRTIVADPPWHYPDRTGGTWPPQRDNGNVYHHDSMPYPTMSVEQIASLPVASLAERDSHLYLWTTQRWLRDSFGVVDAWGFRIASVLVWSKPPKGIAGSYVCSTEFCLFARRGSLSHKQRHIGTCFSWPRQGHSTKPEAFLDVVEQVSPGPYLELFARRARFGWDYAGDESLGTAEMSKEAG